MGILPHCKTNRWVKLKDQKKTLLEEVTVGDEIGGCKGEIKGIFSVQFLGFSVKFLGIFVSRVMRFGS